MTNYTKTTVGADPRVELHDALNLTGAEVSITLLPAGQEIPFIHAHKLNEEIYGILEGKGGATIDGENVPLQQGDWLRLSPAAKRQFRAAPDSDMKYLCIQVKTDSLGEYTADDAILE